MICSRVLLLTLFGFTGGIIVASPATLPAQGFGEEEIVLVLVVRPRVSGREREDRARLFQVAGGQRVHQTVGPARRAVRHLDAGRGRDLEQVAPRPRRLDEARAETGSVRFGEQPCDPVGAEQAAEPRRRSGVPPIETHAARERTADRPRLVDRVDEIRFHRGQIVFHGTRHPR